MEHMPAVIALHITFFKKTQVLGFAEIAFHVLFLGLDRLLGKCPALWIAVTMLGRIRTVY